MGRYLDQFQSAHCLLWDESLGLYVHGCDVSRLADWAESQRQEEAGVYGAAQRGGS